MGQLVDCNPTPRVPLHPVATGVAQWVLLPFQASHRLPTEVRALGPFLSHEPGFMERIRASREGERDRLCGHAPRSGLAGEERGTPDRLRASTGALQGRGAIKALFYVLSSAPLIR